MQWFSVSEVAAQRKVSRATIRHLVEDGQLAAVNVARKSSVRKRWRISEEALKELDRLRRNEPDVDSSECSGPVIQRAKKDYFANVEVAR